jgi:hypothetical protein
MPCCLGAAITFSFTYVLADFEVVWQLDITTAAFCVAHMQLCAYWSTSCVSTACFAHSCLCVQSSRFFAVSYSMHDARVAAEHPPVLGRRLALAQCLRKVFAVLSAGCAPV